MNKKMGMRKVLFILLGVGFLGLLVFIIFDTGKKDAAIKANTSINAARQSNSAQNK